MHYDWVTKHSSGSSLNAPFNAWTMADVIQGCGDFKYYVISGGETNQLTYPEPGYSLTGHCEGYESRCRNVRVNDGSYSRQINF
jgi:hypothetical protein